MPILPIHIATQCFDRAEAFLNQARLMQKNSEGSGLLRNDIRRMGIVLGVAAIDAYMHAIVLRKINSIKQNPPKSLRKLELAFGDAADLTNRFIASQQAGNRTRPWVHLKEALRKRLTKETFQSYDQIGEAMSMSGVVGGWTQVCGRLNLSSSQVQNTLSRILFQRNRIVHEGDIVRLARPRSINFVTISASQARKDVLWMRNLVNAIDFVLNSP